MSFLCDIHLQLLLLTDKVEYLHHNSFIYFYHTNPIFPVPAWPWFKSIWRFCWMSWRICLFCDSVIVRRIKTTVFNSKRLKIFDVFAQIVSDLTQYAGSNSITILLNIDLSVKSIFMYRFHRYHGEHLCVNKLIFMGTKLDPGCLKRKKTASNSISQKLL